MRLINSRPLAPKETPIYTDGGCAKVESLWGVDIMLRSLTTFYGIPIGSLIFIQSFLSLLINLNDNSIHFKFLSLSYLFNNFPFNFFNFAINHQRLHLHSTLYALYAQFIHESSTIYTLCFTHLIYPEAEGISLVPTRTANHTM